MIPKLEQAICVFLALCLIAIGFTVAFNLGQKRGQIHAIEHLQVEQVMHYDDQYGIVIYYQGNEYLHVCNDR